MTKHSQENIVKFLEKGLISEACAAKLLAKCRKALSLKKYQASTAVVVDLTVSVSKTESHREFWADSDRLVAIIRNGKVVTVMLSRKSQETKEHFRTDFIFK